MCKRLSSDINKIKSSKVVLQKNMESSAKQFANWKAEREKVCVWAWEGWKGLQPSFQQHERRTMGHGHLPLNPCPSLLG
jgi:hypothetical protein